MTVPIRVVTDFIVDNNGDVTTAVVSVGGWLGVGKKDVVAGRREQPEGKIQERYGLTKDAAHKDVDDWISDRDLTHPSECMLRVHDDERRTGLVDRI